LQNKQWLNDAEISSQQLRNGQGVATNGHKATIGRLNHREGLSY
jgi:hypothetical protein